MSHGADSHGAAAFDSTLRDPGSLRADGVGTHSGFFVGTGHFLLPRIIVSICSVCTMTPISAGPVYRRGPKSHSLR